MKAINDNYPIFEPDQLLTSENLNNMFSFVEEQERLTRSNLIGIGIVCGLSVNTEVTGNSITITKGTGVTSEGYIITHEDETYIRYRDFDAVKEEYYDIFVSSSKIDGKEKYTQKYQLWELLPGSTETGNVLSKSFLEDKIVILFYEKIIINAKNCDTTSCDDKGSSVNVNIKKLLIKKSDADKIIIELNNLIKSFPPNREKRALNKEIKMPVFNVPSNDIVYVNDIFESYQKIFSQGFVNLTGNSLNQLYETYKFFLGDIYNSNPFLQFKNTYKYLYDGTISGNNLLHFQYNYDLFSDIINSYNELRQLGYELEAICCPDVRLFPRHLFLGEAVGFNENSSKYRTYFIPSPILDEHKDKIKKFRMLFVKLVIMTTKFNLPIPKQELNQMGIDNNIRITPSKLNEVSLSDKAIPYYYLVNDGSIPLFKNWNYEKTKVGEEKYNLSYHSNKYNFEDDFIIYPNKYNQEDNDFLRVEGHIGKSYEQVLFTLNYLKQTYRMPIDIIALSASQNPVNIDFKKLECHFRDLETIYNSLKQDFICLLCKTALYLYDIKISERNQTPKSFVPKVEFIKQCSSTFKYKEDTIGYLFEQYYPTLKKSRNIEPEFFLKASANTIEGVAGLKLSVTELSFIGILYQIIRTAEELKTYLSQVNYSAFSTEFYKMIKINGSISGKLRNSLKTETTVTSALRLEDIIDHLDELYYACQIKSFEAIVTEYKNRVTKLMKMKQFGEFIKKHPGIRHKAGVPLGGTFIIVYHEKSKAQVVQEKSISEFVVTENFVSDELTDNIIITKNEPAVSERALAGSNIGSSNAKINNIINELSQLGLSNQQIANITNEIIAKPVAGKFDKIINNYADGTVVADFYLPYICSSDCEPIQFIVPMPELRILFALQKNEFCSDDPNKYIFTINPSSGIVTGEGVKKESEGVFSFQPSLIDMNNKKDKEITFTYKIDNENSATINVKVYRKPEVKILSEILAIGQNTVSFKIDDTSAITAVEWNFGDGSVVSNEISPTHTYQKPGTYNVKLKTTNGICSSFTEYTLELKELEPVTIQLKKEEYCNDENENYPIKITPTSGEVTGEGVIKSGVGYNFNASLVNMSGLESKIITLTNKTADSRQESINVKVYSKPKVEISFDQIGDSGLFLFTAITDFGKQFNWDFGDNSKDTGNPVTHKYQNQGSYNVFVEVRNGVCISLAKPVTVEYVIQEVKKVCQELIVVTKSFSTLSKIDADNFPAFKETYKPYPDIEIYISQLNQIASLSNEEKLNFFIENPPKSEWLDIVINNRTVFGKFRTMAIATFRILVDLITTVSCIKTKDLTEEIDFSGHSEIIIKNLLKITKLGDSLNETEKNSLKQILEDLQDDRALLIQNRENEKKPEYLAFLDKSIDIFK